MYVDRYIYIYMYTRKHIHFFEKRNKGLFLVNDIQTPPPLTKSCFHFLVQKLVQCSETNEKSIF